MNRNRSLDERTGRVNRELMEKVVAEFRRSGKSKNAFARELGVAWKTLDRWCSQVVENGGLKLLPVRVTERQKRTAPKECESVADAGTLEIVSPGGWRLRVSSGVDVMRVRELLTVLGQC